jgi:hypothetical protein
MSMSIVVLDAQSGHIPVSESLLADEIVVESPRPSRSAPPAEILS